MSTQMFGYVGSETVPDCTYNVCWYVPSTPGTITQATLDSIKQMNGVDNNRMTDLGKVPSYKYIATGILYQEPTGVDMTEL